MVVKPPTPLWGLVGFLIPDIRPEKAVSNMEARLIEQGATDELS